MNGEQGDRGNGEAEIQTTNVSLEAKQHMRQ